MTTRTPSRPLPRRTTALIAGLVLVTAPLLGGCFSGFGATTTMQASMNSGNGTQEQLGQVRIENATLVMGPDGSGTATLIASIVNQAYEVDRLTGVVVNGKAAYVTPGSEELRHNELVSYGYDGASWINSYGVDVTVSTYVPVQLQFEKAGIIDFTVLAVPPTGIYAGIAPTPLTEPVA